jgi:hypothetical protein
MHRYGVFTLCGTNVRQFFCVDPMRVFFFFGGSVAPPAAHVAKPSVRPRALVVGR